VDPSTGLETARIDVSSDATLAIRLERARAVFREWRTTPLADRCRLMERMADELESRFDVAARLMATEMGKPLGEGRSEVEKSVSGARYYATHAPDFLKDESAVTEARQAYVSHRPLGPVLAIMPWNYPIWQVIRAAAPALLAGNPVLLKHAPNVPACADLLQAVFDAAGFPDGCFQNLFITHEQAAEVIRGDVVRGVTLTGSVAAGKTVAAAAAAQIKPTVLELGGSDPYVILEDADVEHAARQCATSRLLNAGQSCIAAKRLVVVDAVRGRFTQALVAAMRSVRMGSPLDPNTELGPMAREDLRATLHEQVTRSVERGARCLLGGEIPGGAGWYYPPTILDQVEPGMPAYEEELFGPVASVLRASDRDEAIEIANDTSFGLGAAVFTADLEEGARIAREELHAGSCFVNTFVRSDPRLPFGGVGESGYGRELGRQGILAFTNTKTVLIA